MKHVFRLVAVLPLFAHLQSCQQERSYRLVAAADLPDYGTAPLVNTMYVGSDLSFHYFDGQNRKKQEYYKVGRDELNLSETAELGSRRIFIHRADDGTLDLLELKRSEEPLEPQDVGG